MANIGTLSVKLVANLREFARGMKTAATGAKSFATKVGAAMKKAGRAIKTFALNAARNLKNFATKWAKRAALAFVALGIAAVKFAADAQESEALVGEVFMGMTDQVVDWSENLQQQLGLNAVELRKQAGFFKLLADSLGVAEETSARLAMTLTELAADMASFRNKKFEEIFDAMKSGIVGMSRPLQNLGITIQDNALQQLLLREGIKATTNELSQGAKVLARYITILEATEKDMGDLDRTYNSFTNVVRVLGTQFKVLLTELGGPLMKALAPAAIRLRNFLLNNREDWVEWFKDVMEKLQDFLAFFSSTTWTEGISRALELTLQMFQAFLKVLQAAMVDGMKALGAGMGNALTQGVFDAMARAKLVDEIFAKMGKGMSDRIAGFVSGGRVGVSKELLAKVKAQAQAELDRIKAGAGGLGFFSQDGGGFEQTKTALRHQLANLRQEFKTIGTEGAKLRKKAAADMTEAEAKHHKEFLARQAERKIKVQDEIANATAQLKEMVAVNEQAAEEVGLAWQDTATTIKDVMRTANEEVRFVFSDMLESMAVEMDNFGDIFKQFVVNLMQEIARMEARLLAARILGSSESGGLGLGNIFSSVLKFLGGGLGMAKGGIVKPVYAAQGFTPRGTDTVPAMLTPGEAVLPKSLTEALRTTLGMGGGTPQPATLNINVQAIDAKGTAEFLNKNKRTIAGMLNQTIRGNSPTRRMIGEVGR